jgi:hypothetical protein
MAVSDHARGPRTLSHGDEITAIGGEQDVAIEEAVEMSATRLADVQTGDARSAVSPAPWIERAARISVGDVIEGEVQVVLGHRLHPAENEVAARRRIARRGQLDGGARERT